MLSVTGITGVSGMVSGLPWPAVNMDSKETSEDEVSLPEPKRRSRKSCLGEAGEAKSGTCDEPSMPTGSPTKGSPKGSPTKGSPKAKGKAHGKAKAKAKGKATPKAKGKASPKAKAKAKGKPKNATEVDRFVLLL